MHDGDLVAVHVWLDSAPVQKTFPLRIGKQLMESMHIEHLEAFLQHAYEEFSGNAESRLSPSSTVPV